MCVILVAGVPRDDHGINPPDQTNPFAPSSEMRAEAVLASSASSAVNGFAGAVIFGAVGTAREADPTHPLGDYTNSGLPHWSGSRPATPELATHLAHLAGQSRSDPAPMDR